MPFSSDQQHILAVGDVFPLPLHAELNWAAEGWEVNVLMVTDVSSGGYESVAIWSHREPYAQPGERAGTDPDEADRVLDAGLTAFALRLRDLLADNP